MLLFTRKIQQTMIKINAQKLLNYLFYIFIFFLPWQTILIIRENFIGEEKFQYATVGVYFFEIFLLLWIILSFSSFKIQKYKNKSTLFLLLFIMWSLVSIFWSSDRYFSLFFSFHLILGSLLFLLIQKTKISTEKIAWFFLTSSFFSGLLGIYQFFSQSNFSNKWLGISNHPTWQGGVSVLENSLGRWLRAYGGMPHPNILGGLLAISLILGIFLYLNLKNNKNLLKSILLIILSVNFLALLTTFSRSSWIGLFFGFALIIFYLYQKKEAFLLKKIFSILLVFIAILSIFILSYAEILFPRFTNNSRLERKSTNERIVLLNESREIISNNYFLGVGIGNYTNHLYKNSQKNKEIWKFQPVHNSFLLVFSELGIFGILIFAGILFLIFKDKIRSLKQKKIENVFFLSTLIIMLISLVFDHWIWTLPSGIILFWLLLGFYKKY